MATFIDSLTETEQAQEIASFLNKIKTKGKEQNETYFEECSKLIDENQFLEVLKKFISEIPMLINEATEKEIEGFLFVILSLAKKASTDSIQKVLPSITESITSSKEDKTLLRLRLLNSVYNSLGSSYQDRFSVYLQILKYAISTKQADLLSNQIKENDIDSKFSEWNLNAQQKRELLHTLREIFSNSIQTYKWNIKYLNSLDAQTNEAEIISIVSEAIKSPTQFQYDDLLNIPTIKKLESKPFYGLLNILANDNLESYKAFIQKNPTVIADLGLNKDDVERKIRLLSLVTLASNEQEIAYEKLAKTLHIPETDVEIWVVNAISEDLISGKMDQIKKTVTISQSLQRSFDKPQWKNIADVLTQWRGNVKTMLETLQETKKNPNALTRAFQQS